MAADSEPTGGAPIPPKLDLRRSGVLKKPADSPAETPAEKSAEPAAAKPNATPAASAQPATPAQVAAPQPVVIKPAAAIPAAKPAEPAVAPKSPLAAPAATAETPPTPVAAPKPVASALGPKPVAAAPVSTAEPKPIVATPAPKPLAATVTPPSAEPKEGTGGGPKTVKVKRPAFMPAGQSPAAAVPKPADSGSDASSVPQPKPIIASEAKTVQAAAKPAIPVSDAKKKTSRIPLEAATLAPDGNAPKTIRLKPSSSKTTPKVSPLAAASAEPPAPAGENFDKRKTSRISLESALASEQGEGGKKDGPKTIRLKRPSEAATIKVSQKPKIGSAPAPIAMDKTAPLENIVPDGDGDTPTRKKTIKVKRPTQGVSAVGGGGEKKGLTIKRSGGPKVKVGAGAHAVGAGVAGAAEEGAPVVEPPKHDEPGVFFLVVSIFAMLVVGVAIYVICSQAFGPNLSLTQLSWDPTGADLPWYGKVPNAATVASTSTSEMQ